MLKTANQTLFPQFKQQAIKLDDALENRYGNQYRNIKTRFDVMRQWAVVSEQTKQSNDAGSDSQSEIVIEVDSEAD